MIKNLQPAMAEAGKIKLGELGEARQSKSGGTYRMPVKLDEFKLTQTYRDAGGQLIEDEALMEQLSEYRDPDGKLRHIPIVLHSDAIDEVFPSAYARYAGKKLHCHGDGETAERFELKKDGNTVIRTGEKKTCKCPCAFLDDKSCKPHGILYCSIRVPDLAVAGAVHTYRTTSIISIQRVVGSLTQILKATGVLQGLPLMLSVQPVQVAPDGKSSTVYCAHVELRAKDIMAAQRLALETAQMRAQLAGEVASSNERYRALLKAPAVDEDDDEQEAVAAEFHATGPGNAKTVEAIVSKSNDRASSAAEIRGRLTAPSETPKVVDLALDYGPPAMTDEEVAAAEATATAHEELKGDGKSREQREAEFKAKHGKQG